VDAGVLVDCRVTAKTVLKKEIGAFRILRHVLAQLSLSRRTWKPKLEVNPWGAHVALYIGHAGYGSDLGGPESGTRSHRVPRLGTRMFWKKRRGESSPAKLPSRIGKKPKSHSVATSKALTKLLLNSEFGNIYVCRFPFTSGTFSKPRLVLVLFDFRSRRYDLPYHLCSLLLRFYAFSIY
jgi:hypothetical protein